jgi:hypothetical protein
MEGQGHQGLTASAMGLTYMGMSEFDGAGDEQESIATIPQRSNLLSSMSKTRSLTILLRKLNLRNCNTIHRHRHDPRQDCAVSTITIMPSGF